MEETNYSEKVLELILNHQLLQAVKLFKEENNCSLSEAKQAIDRKADELGVLQKSSGMGCAALLLIATPPLLAYLLLA